MDLERLHSSSLEKLYGEIKGDIIKQDEHFRIVPLKDHQSMTRTSGLVRFFDVDQVALKIAPSRCSQINVGTVCILPALLPTIVVDWPRLT
jgi:glycerol-3-phosphate responsive antiterminator